MTKLTANDLMGLEEYHRQRRNFRQQVLAHKKNRRVAIGGNATLYFENQLTIKYQVQEMLRIERIFELEAIEEELAAYNPLIPDGSNFKATFMVEFPDAEERRYKLTRLTGIEETVYAQVEGHAKIAAISDEDLDRSTDEKTSAVHFMRFELDEAMRAAFKDGAAIGFGIDHPNYTESVPAVQSVVRDSLVADLD